MRRLVRQDKQAVLGHAHQSDAGQHPGAAPQADDQRGRDGQEHTGLGHGPYRAQVIKLGKGLQLLRTQGFAGLGVEGAWGAQIIAKLFPK